MGRVPTTSGVTPEKSRTAPAKKVATAKTRGMTTGIQVWATWAKRAKCLVWRLASITPNITSDTARGAK